MVPPPTSTSGFLLLFISDLLIQVFSQLKLAALQLYCVSYLHLPSPKWYSLTSQKTNKLSVLLPLPGFFLLFVSLLLLIFLNISAVSLTRFGLFVHFKPERIFWLHFTCKTDKCYLKMTLFRNCLLWKPIFFLENTSSVYYYVLIQDKIINTFGLEQFSNGKGKTGMLWLLVIILLSDQST